MCAGSPHVGIGPVQQSPAMWVRPLRVGQGPRGGRTFYARPRCSRSFVVAPRTPLARQHGRCGALRCGAPVHRREQRLRRQEVSHAHRHRGRTRHQGACRQRDPGAAHARLSQTDVDGGTGGSACVSPHSRVCHKAWCQEACDVAGHAGAVRRGWRIDGGEPMHRSHRVTQQSGANVSVRVPVVAVWRAFTH